MRFCRAEAQGELFYGIIEGDIVARLSGAPYEGYARDGRVYDLQRVKLLAPAEPSKIVAVGKNYLAHALEMKEGVPDEPLLFLKPSTCVIGPDDAIVYPRLSKRLDYEAELGVVIGKRCRNVQPGGSAGVIFGYTCLNDVTARDIQKGDPQWTRGKSFDTFCPIGPWIETELDPACVQVESRLNGELRQSAKTDMLIHSIDRLITYITACMTLLPGDIVATGTPEGVGPMLIGDVIEVSVEGVGILKNTVGA